MSQTTKKIIENKIKMEYDLLMNIFEKIENPIFVIDINGKILELNNAAYNFCNTITNLVGESLIVILKNIDTEYANFIKSILKNKNATDFKNFTFKLSNGKEKYITLTSNLLLSENGKIKGFLIIISFLNSNTNQITSYYGIIGKSLDMQNIFNLINKFSKFDSTILILGETGTGKELIAEALHKCSDRADKPFIKVNCSSLPEPLIESELFGAVKGAYTGAIEDRLGRLHIADGGTIFFDEIGDIPLNTQVKLLRFLQEREFEKVGCSDSIKVDTRIIAATNRNLKKLIVDGKFREDLYYRLNVLTIKVPPLRKRKGDIEILLNYFIDFYSKKFKRNIFKIPEQIMNFFKNYHWPGNIRELKHAIEHLAIMTNGDTSSISDLPEDFHDYFEKLEKNNCQKDNLLKALEKANGNKTKAANILNISRRTLYRKLKYYNIV